MTTAEQLHAEKRAHRLVQLVVGLLGYGTALVLIVESSLGASSWTVLAEGVALRTGTTFGMATNLVALVVLVFWIPLRELPGLGTLLNVVLVGGAADGASLVVPAPSSLPQQLLYLVLGLVLLAFFDALYLGARFGSGPRDGLMTGAVRATGKPVWLVRTGIEAVVLAIGWRCGGTVGFGTLLIAVAMGPLVQRFLRLTTVHLRGDRHFTDAERPADR